MKKIGEKRFVEELLQHRDSKMRRFCNYFVTLFNQKKINPFTQFIQQAKLKSVKATVREKMDLFTNGELKPSDDPDMVAPAKDSEQQAATSDSKDENREKEKAEATEAGAATITTNRNTIDEFKDKEGLHYKADMKATSKTPGPNMLGSSAASNNIMI